MEILDNIVNEILPYTLLFNVLLYLYSAFKIKVDKSLNLLTLYLFLIFVNQAFVSYLASFKINNLFLFHIYLVIQFVLLSFFYRSLFLNKQKKIVDILLVVILLTFVLYYILWPEDFLYFNLPEIIIATIPVLAYIMNHLYNSLTIKGRYLYFSGGLLMYLSISSLVFLLYALMSGDTENKILSVNITRNVSTINTICYFLLQLVIFLEWKLNISKWEAKKAL